MSGILSYPNGVLSGRSGVLATQPNPNDPSWYRQDGSMKGMGFMGPMKFKDGRTSTELSIGVNIDGKEMDIPSLVPTLSQDEIAHLLGGGSPTTAIVNKAIEHAMRRRSAGLPVFATPQDWPPQP